MLCRPSDVRKANPGYRAVRIVSGVDALDDAVTLLDWRPRLFALYADVRAAREPAEAWPRWRGARDRLFREHPQSPLPAAERAAFDGVDYFPYDPALRALALLEAALHDGRHGFTGENDRG